jgi:hypothetical protein
MKSKDLDESARFGQASISAHDILIDGHVHFHKCFSLPLLLDTAAENFSAAAENLGIAAEAFWILLLCEDEGYENFFELVKKVETRDNRIDGWTLFTSLETTVVIAQHDNGGRLFIIAGRQIRTREGIELLALCTDIRHADGLAIDVSLANVRQTGGVAVLPWGFGKWLGKRGEHVKRLITGPTRQHLLLGDNSGRLSGLGDPSEFRMARGLGMSILSGTDPLPFPAQLRRIGRYGSHLRGAFEEDKPGESIRLLLQSRTSSLVTYGDREQPAAFLVNQLRIQARNRLRIRGFGAS